MPMPTFRWEIGILPLTMLLQCGWRVRSNDAHQGRAAQYRQSGVDTARDFQVIVRN